MGIATEDLPSLKNSILKGLKNGNVKLVVEHINTLKSWKASTESLKSTRIGVFVTDLRKHDQANDEIKAASKDCVGKWKYDIGRSSVPNLTTSSTHSKKAALINDNNISSNEVSTQSIIERNATIDKISFGSSLNDKTRIKCSEVLYSALASGTDFPSKDIAKVTKSVEEAVFKHFKSVSDQYKSKLRSLVSNLRDKGNPNLKIRVLEGEIAPEYFALMTAEELMSEDRQALVTEVRKANMEEALTQKPVHSATDIFKCGKCKERRTTYYQMQTRSADEPMTTFVTCLVCDNRWKFC